LETTSGDLKVVGGTDEDENWHTAEKKIHLNGITSTLEAKSSSASSDTVTGVSDYDLDTEEHLTTIATAEMATGAPDITFPEDILKKHLFTGLWTLDDHTASGDSESSDSHVQTSQVTESTGTEVSLIVENGSSTELQPSSTTQETSQNPGEQFSTDFEYSTVESATTAAGTLEGLTPQPHGNNHEQTLELSTANPSVASPVADISDSTLSDKETSLTPNEELEETDPTTPTEGGLSDGVAAAAASVNGRLPSIISLLANET
uniref:Sushi domain-containing protein n=1 Tax=Hydatigena taeniaeformis TaxID=6205 RepID=A0A158RDJ2_HYDTA